MQVFPVKPKEKDEAYYEAELQKAIKEKELFDKRAEVDDIRKQMRRWKPPTTTKIIMLYIFANCTAVEVYSMVAMWMFANLEALYALISAVISESLSFAVYAAKAYNETKQEELIKLERDKMEAEPGDDQEEAEAEGDGAEEFG